MSVTIQQRRDSAANWATANPVLHQGEFGLETDTGKAKAGDGSTAWTSLGYWQPGGADFTSLLTRTAVQTANYTASANQIVPVDTTSGSVTVTLPNAPAAGTMVSVKQVTLGTGHAVTVACAGSDVFNKSGGGTSGTLSLLAQGMLLHYNGAGIWTVLSDDLPLSQTDARYQLMSSYAAPGDLLYGTGAATSGKLAGNTSAAQALLAQTGTGSASAAPVWMYPAAQTLPKPTGVAATDTANIQAAENALNALGGGALLFQAGTYVVTGLTKQGAIIWQGAGRFATVIQLANGANTDVIQGANFAALTLTGSLNGIGGWAIRDLSVNGNRANQSGTSYGIRVYGYNFDLSDVSVYGCLSGGLYSEWAGTGNSPPGGDELEARYRGVKIHDCNVVGWHDRGPHDSRTWDISIYNIAGPGIGYWAESGAAVTVAAGSNAVDLSTFTSGSPGTLHVSTTLNFPTASISTTQGQLTVATALGNVTLTYTGVTAQAFTGCVAHGAATGSTVSTGGAVAGIPFGAVGNLHMQMHVYGAPLYDYVLDCQIHLIDCIGEVAASGGVIALLRSANIQVSSGLYIIYPSVPGNLQGVSGGIQIGDTVNAASLCRIDTSLGGFAGTSAGTAALNVVFDGGMSSYDLLVSQPTGQAVFGSPQLSTRQRIRSTGQGNAGDAANSFITEYGQVSRFLPSSQVAWSLAPASAPFSSEVNYRTASSPHRFEWAQGITTRWYSDNYSTVKASLDGSTGNMTLAGTLAVANGAAAGQAATVGQVLTAVQSTGAAGYALVNGTGNILTWTAPNDGQLHRFTIFSFLYVATAATGGAITIAYSVPGAGSVTHTFYTASQASSPIGPSLSGLQPVVQPGTTVTLAQNTALTGGAATLFAEIWAL